jgi:hypothetical protein
MIGVWWSSCFGVMRRGSGLRWESRASGNRPWVCGSASPIRWTGLVPDVVDDQVEQLAGQDQRGMVPIAGQPQPGKDRQAHRPGEQRRVTADADHHPAVTQAGRWRPGPAVSWCQATPCSLRPVRRQIVHGQHQRRAGRDQGGADQLQQHQSELVSRPACGREEPVGQVVVAPASKSGADQQPGDGALARLSQESRPPGPGRSASSAR